MRSRITAGNVPGAANVWKFKMTVIYWQGRLTLEDGVERLRTLVRESRGSVVLDLRQVTEVDSSGLAELLRSRTVVRGRGGALKLGGVPRRLEHVLRITRLDRLFEAEEAPARKLELVAA
jgi:anti-sigma B factor antagonist